MSRTSLIDGRLADGTKPGNLLHHFPSTVTIQSRASGQDALGQPSGAFANVTGLVNIACSVGLPKGQAQRTPIDVTLHEDQEILLAGYFPSITTAMQAVVTGGATYLILSVFQDPLSQFTRLAVERVSI